MFAAAARIGAPLGHDFCAISLSDNLKPWEIIEKRLRIRRLGSRSLRRFRHRALQSDFSKARPWQLGRGLRPPARACRAAADAGDLRPRRQPADEQIEIADLASADPARADMRTLVMIGSSATRLVPRPNGEPWVYTPRSVEAPVS